MQSSPEHTRESIQALFARLERAATRLVAAENELLKVQRVRWRRPLVMAASSTQRRRASVLDVRLLGKA